MSELPAQWDPRRVAVNRDKKNAFLLRPGQILVGPGDAADVAEGPHRLEARATCGRSASPVPARAAEPGGPGPRGARRARADPQGDVRPPAGPGPGRAQPRLRRRERRSTSTASRGSRAGPGSSARVARLAEGAAAAHDPRRRRKGRADRRARHRHVRAPVADRRPERAEQRRRLGRRERRLRGRRVRPRHVHRRADPAGRAGRLGLRRQGPRLARPRRRPDRRQGDGAAAAGHRHRQPVARRLHRRRLRPAGDRQRAADHAQAARGGRRRGRQRRQARARSGPPRSSRCWAPARSSRRPEWSRARYSNYGWWVDAAARGTNLQSTFTREKTKVAQGRDARPIRRSPSTAGRPGTARRSRRRSPPRCSPARCPATASRRPPRRRPTCSRARRPRRSPTSRSPCCSTSSRASRAAPRSTSRGSRSARRAGRRAAARTPARSPSSTNRPRSSACTLSGVLARALDRHRRVRRRQQLPRQAALARAGLGHLELDARAAATRTTTGAGRRAADEQTSLLLGGGVGAVAQQLGDLGVDGAPAERGACGVVEQLRHRVHVREDRAQLGFGGGVLVGHSNSLRSVAVTPSPSASPRRRSRHR